MINFNLNMNYIHYKVWEVITSFEKFGMKLPSQTATVQPLKFKNGYVMLAHTLLVTWLFVHAGIIDIHCQ